MSAELVVAVVLVLASGGIAGRRLRQGRRERQQAAAVRAIESRLMAEAASPGGTGLREFLDKTQLWVVIHADAPTVPVALVLRAPEELVAGGGGEPVAGARKVETAPVILCFSSERNVERFSPALASAIRARGHRFEPMRVGEIFRQGVARGVMVRMNPEGEVTRDFGVEEMRRVLGAAEG
jgi:hypothetical protein